MATPAPAQILQRVQPAEYRSSLSTARQSPYDVQVASGLTPTADKTFYQLQEQMRKKRRMSTAAEELTGQLYEERKGNDSRKAAFFNGLFGRGKDKVYRWQWTSTGLRVPAGLEAPKSYREVIDDEIHQVYHFIVLEGDKEVGEALVPRGDFRIVTSWNEVHGIPRTTTNENLPYDKHTTHWNVKLNPSVDLVSGKRDVAVQRWGGWLRDEHGRCLCVDADGRRSNSGLYGGFRPVQGSLVLPSFEKIAMR